MVTPMNMRCGLGNILFIKIKPPRSRLPVALIAVKINNALLSDIPAVFRRKGSVTKKKMKMLKKTLEGFVLKKRFSMVIPIFTILLRVKQK